MELLRIERKERPSKCGERLVSTYSLSAEDLVHIAGFSATRDLSATYGKGCAPNHPDREKSSEMVQESSRTLNPIISQLFLPQGFKSYIPTVFYVGINFQLKGPELDLKLSEDEEIKFRPAFFIESVDDLLEVETYLQAENGSRMGGNDQYVPILVEAYNKRANVSVNGVDLPILGISGLGVEVAEARLARKAFESLQEIVSGTTMKKLDELRQLREGIMDEERNERKKEAILRALRREYGLLIGQII
ncbi:MAG: hypothetical protein AABX10_02995 [Nanoarchaeota archaeon]